MKTVSVAIGVFTLLLAAILSSESVSAQAVVNLTVNNVPPNVIDVVTDYYVVPSINSSTLLWCNATVTDLNGISDINTTTAVLWHPKTAAENSPDNVTNHYTPISYHSTPNSSVSLNVYFLFSLHPHVNQGEWTCKVKTVDYGMEESSNQTNLTIHPIVCSNGRWDEGEILTDCGGICPSCLASPGVVVYALVGTSNTSSINVTSITRDSIDITKVVTPDLNSSYWAINSSSIIVSPANMSLEGFDSGVFHVTVFVPADLNETTVFTGLLTFHSHSLFNVSFPLTVVGVVPNYLPEIIDISITSPVVLLPNASTDVWCNATVSDGNGFSDVKSATAVLWKNQSAEDYSADNPKNHYTSTKIFFSQSNDSKVGTVSAFFSLFSEAEPGLWYCRVFVTDSGPSSAFLIKPFIVYPFSCSDGIFTAGQEELTDCGLICPLCLEANDFSLSVIAGTTSMKDATLRSNAGEPLFVRDFSISKFVTYTQNKTLNASTAIEPKTLLMQPHSVANMRFIVNVSAGERKDSYYGKVNVFTNTTVKAMINVLIDVVLRGSDYISVEVNKTCVNETMGIFVREEGIGLPLEGANVSVSYKARVVYFSVTPKEGRLYFTPANAGDYAIEVSRDDYHTESLDVSIPECFKEGTCFDGIQNCHDGRCEIGIDCGGPCPPCSSCFNGEQDNGESGIDCDGPCRPCHCFNGMTDGDEVGIDCGGSCEICPMLQFIPSLSLRVPAEVMSGEEFNITVVDDGGNGVSAFVRIKKPDGKEMFLTTNRKGFTSVKSDVPGYWQLTAVKAGYLPAIARVRVIEIVTPEVMIYRTVSYLLPILVGLSMLLYLLTRRTKVVFDPAALLKIIEEDRLMEYTKVFVVENVYNELSTRAGSNKNRLVPLKLSDRELGKADDISSEYGIEVSLARALLLAEKLKAKTLYTGAQTGNLGKMYRGIKIVQK